MTTLRQMRYALAVWRHWRALTLTGAVPGTFAAVQFAFGFQVAGVSPWVWVTVAVVGLMIAQYLAWRDVAGDVAPPVRVTIVEPFDYGTEVLFRLAVHNDGNRRAGFYGRVTDLEGTVREGPERGYSVCWRGHTGKNPCLIPPREEDWIDLALGTRSMHEWRESSATR
jgi:hypothetical protein